MRQAFGDTPQVLTEALQDGVNLAVWQRRLPVQIEDYARLLLSLNQPLGESRVIELDEQQQLPDLSGLLGGYADLEGHVAFVTDVAWLVAAYACLLDARRVGLRLQALGNAMCPRFHVDHVPLRLLSTYAGPGSEWLGEGAIDRTQLAREQPHAEAIRQLAEGEVALLKGEKWLGNQGGGLVHRSPALANGERRLILSLDWMA
ncbi:DUF1826 domain-containing protein [Pseudomonas sp. B21-012]|uniref:DUF1826 domain-containing protein n=1 Tax=Pseudomonas sp. B21-012 TaxID=2895472 RepID=UPI00215E2602|nr:DUF1826 domain-containing protein [Pseudomonas sp. B21-012]UVM55962.1 DUF1826 domain-containing protein [Pseudomonas sp. B21-012]